MKKRSGQALVEFALVAPLLMLVLLGIITYGLYINANVTLQQAARIGARAAAIGDSLGCPGDEASQESQNGTPLTIYGVVDQQINQGMGMSIDQPGTNTPIAVLNPPPTETSDGSSSANSYVTVTVTYPYHPILPIPGLLPASINLVQSYTMMVEVPQNPANLSTSGQLQQNTPACPTS
ncbi:MAG: pilus assembly protein [Sulfobacillus sp.]|nr:pilus assembly protein [Sulfobacillus sp.]